MVQACCTILFCYIHWSMTATGLYSEITYLPQYYYHPAAILSDRLVPGMLQQQKLQYSSVTGQWHITLTSLQKAGNSNHFIGELTWILSNSSSCLGQADTTVPMFSSSAPPSLQNKYYLNVIFMHSVKLGLYEYVKILHTVPMFFCHLYPFHCKTSVIFIHYI